MASQIKLIHPCSGWLYGLAALYLRRMQSSDTHFVCTRPFLFGPVIVMMRLFIEYFSTMYKGKKAR
jgi:hypothetical protein